MARKGRTYRVTARVITPKKPAAPTLTPIKLVGMVGIRGAS